MTSLKSKDKKQSIIAKSEKFSKLNYEKEPRKSILQNIENDNSRKSTRNVKSKLHVNYSASKSSIRQNISNQNENDSPKSTFKSNASKMNENHAPKMSAFVKSKSEGIQKKSNVSEADYNLEATKSTKEQRSQILDINSINNTLSKNSQVLEPKQSSFLKASSRNLETKAKLMQSEHSIITDPESFVSESIWTFEGTENENSLIEMSETKKAQPSKSQSALIETYSTSTIGLVEEEPTKPSLIPPLGESSSSSGSSWTNFQLNSFCIDFTPNEDDEKNYKKCMEFWDYIHSRKDLREIFVLPKKEQCLLNELKQQTVSEIIEDQRREKKIEQNPLPGLMKFINLEDGILIFPNFIFLCLPM